VDICSFPKKFPTFCFWIQIRVVIEVLQVFLNYTTLLRRIFVLILFHFLCKVDWVRENVSALKIFQNFLFSLIHRVGLSNYFYCTVALRAFCHWNDYFSTWWTLLWSFDPIRETTTTEGMCARRDLNRLMHQFTTNFALKLSRQLFNYFVLFLW
jgi:hypothetical protein